MLNAFNYIEEQLNFLGYRIETRGRLNLLDLHVRMESFYLHFCNELFGWQLVNVNTTKQNAEAIDLVDDASKIVIQVSATATKSKIESALSNVSKVYSGYRFKFISISKDASSLRDKQFTNPNGVLFDPLTDILDIPSLLRRIESLQAGEQDRIARFLQRELRDVRRDPAPQDRTHPDPSEAQQVKHGKISVDLNATVIEDDEHLTKLLADLIVHYSNSRDTGIIEVELQLLRKVEAKLENEEYGSQWERTSLNSDRIALIEYTKRIERSLRVLAIAGRFRNPEDLSDNARTIVRKIMELSGFIPEAAQSNHIPVMVFTNRYSHEIHALIYPTRDEIAEMEQRLGFPIQGTLRNPQPCSYLPGAFLWKTAFPMMIAMSVWFNIFDNDDEKTAEFCNYDSWLFAHD